MPHMYTHSFVQCHPDKLSAHLTDEERDTAMDKFHTLSKAYQVLSDQESKALYDANSQCECAYINKSLIFFIYHNNNNNNLFVPPFYYYSRTDHSKMAAI